MESGGPAGTAFASWSDLTVEGGRSITVKRQWTLPEYNYTIRVRWTANHPVERVGLSACMNFGGCGTGCGPLYQPSKSSRGDAIRFRVQDLREMRSLSVVSSDGKTIRDLTTPEMRKLLTTHHLVLFLK